MMVHIIFKFFFVKKRKVSYLFVYLAGAEVVITSDIACRGGKVLEIKKIVDQALKQTPCVKTVLVDARDGNTTRVQLQHPRDHFLQDLMNGLNSTNVKDVIEYVDSNDPLFILYTSGSTGKVQIK